MQFLLMVYESPRWPSLPNDEKRCIANACNDWHLDLVRRGIGKAGVGLQGPETSAVVRSTSANGQNRSLITDGPFIESKEVLGGFEIVECRDRAEACAIAETFPALRDGFAMEVRPLMTDADLKRLLNT